MLQKESAKRLKDRTMYNKLRKWKRAKKKT